jgi:polysaccharide pyruvyl transferase WcaK-like protein
MEPHRIAFLGLFGVGNFGNDTSLAVAVDAARVRQPMSKLTCICPASAASEIESRLGLGAVDLQAAGRLGRWTPKSRALRLALRPWLELSRLVTSWREMRDVDQLVVPGTGFFDDFGVTPLQTPLDTFRWMLAARARRVPVALVSIGAGPIRNRLSAFLLLRPVRWAAYVSVRDEGSRRFLADDCARHALVPIRPDLAFGYRIAAPEPAVRTTDRIGLGLMSYYGWRMDHIDGTPQHDRYVDGIVRFTEAMLDRGRIVELAGGDRGDTPTIGAVSAAIRQRRPDLASRLREPDCTNMDDVVAWATRCHVAVASRFHNVIAALLVRRPVAALSYADKFNDLVTTVGLEDALQHIESLSVDRLIADVERLIDQAEQRSSTIDEVVARNAAEVAVQFDLVFGSAQ